jgi:outer membrane protein with beta-barrel domain
MKRCIVLLTGLLLLAFLSAPAFAGGNANFIVGGRTLEKGEWDPLQDQTFFGVNVDFGKERWPVQLEAGTSGSRKDKTFFGQDLTLTVSELSFGVLRRWSTGKNIRLYMGGGLTNITAKIEVSGRSADDSSLGLYGHGGIYWRLGRRFNIGVDARLVRATDINFPGGSTNANYDQLGVLAGWGWPAGK